jgi:hypothetical protein
MMHLQRAQALVETAFFLPVLLLAMMAIIYFSQYGVLQSRAVEAVRYASLVTNPSSLAGQNPAPYSIEAMYAELHLIGTKPGVFPSSSYDCSSSAGGASGGAALAFWQAQTLPAGSAAAASPLPSAPAWFKGSAAAPTAVCTAYPISLPLSGAAYAGNNLLTSQLTTLSTTQIVPGFLVAFSNVKGSAGPVGAAMAYSYSNPATVDYCTPGFTSQLAGELGTVMPAQVGYAGITPAPNPAPVPAGC